MRLIAEPRPGRDRIGANIPPSPTLRHGDYLKIAVDPRTDCRDCPASIVRICHIHDQDTVTSTCDSWGAR